MFDNLYATDCTGAKIPATIEKKKDRYTVTIEKSKIKISGDKLYFLDDAFCAREGDEGYYVGNQDFEKNTGFLTYFKPRTDFDYSTPPIIKLVNMFGVKCKQYTFMAVPVGMGYDSCVHIYKKGDTYHIGLLYDLTRTDIYEDISIDLFLLEDTATFVDMAKRYRSYQIEDVGVKPLKQRIAERPMLDYLKNSVEIRVRQAWKKAPADIPEQTEENEPPIKVAVTFDRVKDMIDELKRQGVEKAEICLIGWNKSGHDGRWPTAFPVEPLLGGEEKLLELIAYAEKNQYKIICHSNSTDCYSISNYFQNGEIACKDKQHRPVINPVTWSGGRMYNLCPQRAWEIAQEILPKIAKLGFRGMHYIDVLSVIEPRNCFDDVHPVNTREAMQYNEKIMKLSQELFGGFSSEGTFDHAAKYLDFGLYTSFNRTREICMDEGIPLWEIAFHGIIMANSAVNTVNYTVKTPNDRIQLIEKCSRPAFYFYSRFVSDGTDWMGKEDLVCDTNHALEESVAGIKQAYDEYQGYCSLQTEFIEDFKRLRADVTETTYTNGKKIVVNYGDNVFEYSQNRMIAAKDYQII